MAMSRSRGGMPTTFLPPMRTSPSVGSSRPAMMLSKVDLPQPEGPTRMRNSPGATWMSTRRRTSTLLSPLPKRLLMPAISSDDAMIESLLCTFTCPRKPGKGPATRRRTRRSMDTASGLQQRGRAFPRLSRRVGPKGQRSLRCSPCQGTGLGGGLRLAIAGLVAQRGYVKVHSTI